MFRLYHFYRKFDNGARGKILAKVALEKAVHKLLEGDTLNVEVGFIQVYRLKVRYDCTEDAVIYLDRIREYFWVFYLLLVVQRIDSLRQLGRRLMRFDLELIRLALFAGFLLIADFDKYQLAKLTEGRRW